jgi:Ca-activated chloride channel family protein
MSLRWAVLAAIAGCMLSPGPVYGQGSPAAPKRDQPPKFRSSVDLVSVAAVVRDRKGRFVSDLSRDDFIVVEGGQRRKILGFQAEDDGPIKVAVLFDISGSMRVGSRLVDAEQAARHLFGALKPGDEAALYAFDTRLDQVHGFTTDFAALEAAIGRVEQPFGQTSLYDAIAETAQAVASQTSTAGRRSQRAAVVVLTDGIDTKSRLTPPQVSGMASSIDVPVYILAVMASIDDPRRDENDTEVNPLSGALPDLARWTGGELFTATAPAQLSIASRQIVDELRHQYLLAFEASTRSGWRPLEVRARQRGLVVKARSGYAGGGSRVSQGW